MIESLTFETMPGYITNQCECDDNDSYNCYGCWDWMSDDFAEFMDEWFVKGDYSISNFPTWHGPVNGYFEARNLEDFLSCITPNSDFYLHYGFEGDTFVGIVGHHDGTGKIYVSKIEDESDVE